MRQKLPESKKPRVNATHRYKNKQQYKAFFGHAAKNPDQHNKVKESDIAVPFCR
jgi:hypothetical protein